MSNNKKADLLEKHFELGTLYDELGQYKDAVREYKLALKINHYDDTVLYNLGVAYGKRRLWQRSIWAYKEAIRVNPCHGDAFYNLGVIYQQILKNEKLASACFMQAIVLQEDNGDALLNLGCLYLDKSKIPLAIFCFDKALSTPNAKSLIPYVYFNWGEIFEKQNDLLTSVYCYKKALDRMPNDTEIKMILARLSKQILR